jgi:hypothetical protein
MKLCDPSVFLSAPRPSGPLVCRALLRSWSSRSLIHGESHDAVPLCLFRARGHPLLGFHSSTGYDRKSPQRCERSRDRSFRVSAVPLMGFSFPSAIANSKDPFAGSPIPQHVASSEFEPLLTPCSPSSLPVISDRVAPGIFAFRALLLSEIRGSFGNLEPS